MKGIILAGGTGSRLHPITHGISKQLVPVYDKPMIYYPLSTLILAGISDILVITTPHDAEQFQRLLGDGSQFGISLSYVQQPSPDGLAQAFILGEDHIGDEHVALVLGDNIFYGPGMGQQLRRHTQVDGATVFGYWVRDPERYGVAEFDAGGKVVFGSTVDLEDENSGARVTYQIVGDDEADLKLGLISISSPIARGLIGKEPGDVAEVQAPGGLRRWEVMSVRYV